MSRAERRHWDIEETKRDVLARDGCCVICGKRAIQLGHVIAQTDMNIARYGEEVIHHPLNMRATCGLKCNKKVEISTKARPLLAAEHVERVREAIRREE